MGGDGGGLSAQTFTTLHTFTGTDGGFPLGALVQAPDGNLYGITGGGGTNNNGTVFKISPSGALTTLYRFCSPPVPGVCTDGAGPNAGFVQATNGDFYGTADGGAPCSSGGCGTVFKITPSGALTTLDRFCAHGDCTVGQTPVALMLQATNGDFYGTTVYGGVHDNGILFKITPTGTLTTVYSFCLPSGCPDYLSPISALVQSTSGDLYGTTYSGGANACRGFNGCGTVFTLTDTPTTLYSFCSQSGCADGTSPNVLIQATDGNFYGTTGGGGADGGGTIFKITPTGTLTTLYSFLCSQGDCTGVYQPTGLIQATDGNFYGTTGGGGANGGGTIFKITPSGTLTTLYSFCAQSGCTDGKYPSGLVQDTNGDFYGTASEGGTSATCGAQGCGTVFTLSVGLSPFVRTQPASGKVTGFVEILGTDLTGATSVSFNGTAAVFKVVSSSLIITTVPAGASSGTVQVVTPGGTLSSSVAFRVLP